MHFLKKIILVISLFGLMSCSSPTEDNNNNNNNENNDDHNNNGGNENNNDNKDDEEDKKPVSFSEVIENTLKNYSFESTTKEIDNLDESQSHFSLKK